MTQITSLIHARRKSDDASVLLLHFEDCEVKQYVNIPENTEQILLTLGPGPEADKLWADEIQGKHSESDFDHEQYSRLQLRQMFGM